MTSFRFFLPLAVGAGMTLGATSEAHARLGFTLQNCIDRYGEPVRKIPSTLPGSDEEAYVFRTDDIEFIYHFQQQRAWHVAIIAKHLTSQQQKQFLTENANNSEWLPPQGEKVGTVRVWLTVEGHQWAVLTELRSLTSLEFMTRAAAETLARQRELRIAQSTNKKRP